jgi:hypothetical protein
VNRALKFIVDRFGKKVPGVSAPPTDVENKLVEEVRVVASQLDLHRARGRARGLRG